MWAILRFGQYKKICRFILCGFYIILLWGYGHMGREKISTDFILWTRCGKPVADQTCESGPLGYGHTAFFCRIFRAQFRIGHWPLIRWDPWPRNNLGYCVGEKVQRFLSEKSIRYPRQQSEAIPWDLYCGFSSCMRLVLPWIWTHLSPVGGWSMSSLPYAETASLSDVVFLPPHPRFPNVRQKNVHCVNYSAGYR